MLHATRKGINQGMIASCYRDRSCQMRGMAIVTESNATQTT
ncbi:hypothetical protein BH24ACT6_BH24ACT6_21840 [soil metagenome]